MPGSHRALIGRLLIATVLATAVGVGAVPALRPATVQASTADTMESEILGWINTSRTKAGLAPLRAWSTLNDLAGYRAGVMASTNTLSHTIGGCLSCQFGARGVPWYSYGEVIAATNYPYGTTAASAIFNWWKGSSSHWPLLMSRSFNYIGVGIAYRSSNHTTYASVVLTESPDHTAPWRQMSSRSLSGTTAHWTWSGGDVRLQTHTAGLKSFDVEYRVDYGSWVVIRSGTTATSLTLYSRAHGHSYALRVRARDYGGNLTSWSTELRISVP